MDTITDTMNTVTMNPVDISLTSHRIPALADDIPGRTLLVTDADEANTEGRPYVLKINKQKSFFSNMDE